MLTIEINGQATEVAQGATVMDAAQKLGVYVPHFCYHKKLSIAANCRMCLVEVEKAPKPLPACATPVTQGMKVFTHSKLAKTAQQGVMEFLLANHPLDCPICDQGGECQLQDLAVGYGNSASKFHEEKRVVMVKNVGPLISMQEMSRCIHCTRCVRFGQEIAGVMELGMAHRNFHSEIQSFVGRTVDSELSGNMIDLCPVGALTSKPFRYTARTWELARRKSVSPHDSLGSNLVVQVKGNRVMRVLPRENEAINECWLSDKDRFSYEGLNSDQRLIRPMIRVDGALREVDWNVALDYVSHGLKDIVKTHGANEVAALASPHSTLEEMALLAKLMRGMGSGNMDSRPKQRDFGTDATRKGIPYLGMMISELSELDSVLVVGSFLAKDHPLLAHRLRQLAKQPHKEVSLVSVIKDDPKINLHSRITIAPAKLAIALGSILKAVAEEKRMEVPAAVRFNHVCEYCRAIAQSLIRGEKAAIFLGNTATQNPKASEIHALAYQLSLLTGATLGFLGEAANTVGAYVAKAIPEAGGANAYEMFATPKKAYVLLGLEPELDGYNPQQAMRAIKGASLTVMLSAFVSETMKAHADVLLPIAPYTETSGTFINTEGRIQSFSGVAPPLGDARPAWKVLRVLANLLDLSGFDYTTSEAIRDELLSQDTEFVTGLNNVLATEGVFLSPMSVMKVERVSDIPIHFADPLVRRATALQKTKDASAPVAKVSLATAELLGIHEAKTVRVTQGDASAILPLAICDTVPEGCAYVSAAHAATSGLGDLFGEISLEACHD